MKGLTFILSGLILCTSVAFAQVDSSEFNIRIFGDADLDPPTTPTLLSVTPIASSQIDISWSASSDNFAIGGYVLFRDDAPVATTTLTTYSDTGLIASTTFRYFVQAFDLAGNYSATSSTLATTTPDIPPPPPATVQATSTNTGGGTATRIILDELVITPGFSTTSFAIKTARPARFEVRWGRTASYELGYIATERFLSDYKTTLTDLEPGTTYEYEVIGYSVFGTASIFKRGKFKTLGNEILYAPQNVTRFTAVALGSNVQLTWQLPVFDTFASVRIVRSHLRYPTHPQDGAVVYQGEATTVTDENILEQYSPAYYTAFVTDTSGRVSSGAIARVFAAENTSGSPETDEEVGGFVPPEPEITPAELLLPEFKMPEANDVFITQGAATDSFTTETIRLRSEELFFLSIPKTAVAKNLKTIVATLTDPTDAKKTYSFLLRINNTDTAYEATVAPLKVVGLSNLSITIYDYEARVVGTRSQVIEFYAGRSTASAVFWPDTIFAKAPQIFAWAFLSWLFILLMVFYRRTVT